MDEYKIIKLKSLNEENLKKLSLISSIPVERLKDYQNGVEMSIPDKIVLNCHII